MTQPKRIQRKRSKGWKMPEGAVYVGRPGKWGNPFRVAPLGNVFRVWSDIHNQFVGLEKFGGEVYDRDLAAKEAVRLYREYSVGSTLDFTQLRGYDLACWCREGEPCHADVLLELANEAKQ